MLVNGAPGVWKSYSCPNADKPIMTNMDESYPTRTGMVRWMLHQNDYGYLSNVHRPICDNPLQFVMTLSRVSLKIAIMRRITPHELIAALSLSGHACASQHASPLPWRSYLLLPVYWFLTLQVELNAETMSSVVNPPYNCQNIVMRHTNSCHKTANFGYGFQLHQWLMTICDLFIPLRLKDWDVSWGNLCVQKLGISANLRLDRVLLLICEACPLVSVQGGSTQRRLPLPQPWQPSAVFALEDTSGKYCVFNWSWFGLPITLL